MDTIADLGNDIVFPASTTNRFECIKLSAIHRVGDPIIGRNPTRRARCPILRPDLSASRCDRLGDRTNLATMGFTRLEELPHSIRSGRLLSGKHG